MKFFYLPAFAALFHGAVLAQAGAAHAGKPEPELVPEQRRTELRHALQAQPHQPASREGQRQLSPQERQALRQQLRQQHPGTARSRNE